ncbi:MAG: molybdenum cofactor biosynthesis protein MoaE [Dehalococcoidales bacterium]|nr:molybdenum cofactor biosynthesis protein MoaE [Dehalococcoidales bacterium]
MIEITDKPIAPEQVIMRAKTSGSGCVVTYVGVIRDNSHDKSVVSVEYQDRDGKAVEKLQALTADAKQKWQVENIAFTHRIGKLKVGDINLVIAVAAGHRGEGFAACQYIIDRFKQSLPTQKIETYADGSVKVGGD